MKSTINKLGYILVILGFASMVYKYGIYLLFLSLFLISGNVELLTITSSEVNNNLNTYYFIINEEEAVSYSSFPTKQVYSVNSKVEVLTIPPAKKVFMGKFLFGPYIVGVALFVFGLFVAVLAFWMIIGVDNKFTQRIKKAYG